MLCKDGEISDLAYNNYEYVGNYFEASVKKDAILFDQDKDLLIQENQIISVEGVNGDALKVGSMEEVSTAGNWPKTYGSNE